MVKFQSSRHGSVLLVEKEDFNAFKKKLESRIYYTIWTIGFYNLFKIALLGILLCLPVYSNCTSAMPEIIF